MWARGWGPVKIRAGAHRRSQTCTKAEWGDETMHLVCEHCGKSYSLSEDRLPRFGARVRCPSCGDLFDIPARRASSARPPVPRWTAPSPFETAAPGVEAFAPDGAPGDSPAATAVLAPSTEAVFAEAAVAGAGAAPEEAPVGSGESRLAVEAPPRVTACAPEAVPPADAAETAKRLVGALAGMHRARLDEARREGRVLAVFAAEIAAAWDLYRRQVPEDASGCRRHFQDAVNEEFFDGKRIF